MPNVTRPNGARPVGHLDGSPWNGRTKEYAVDSANATAVFPGDFVMLEADGNIAPATAGATLLGVAVAIKPDFDNLSRRHVPASTAGTVMVCDSPDVLYEVEEDSLVGNIALADVGTNFDIIAGAGSTTTGSSGHLIDSNSANSAITATAQLRLYDLVNRENNAVGANARWVVLINEHIFKTATGV